MSVLVIGCGSFGKNIAMALSHSGYDVSIIDKNYQNFMNLPESFRGKRINGDAMTRDVIQRAKIDEVQAVILTSRNDVNNIIQSRLFKEVYHLDSIVALNTDPAYRFFYLQMGIPTISLINWGTLRIEEMLQESIGLKSPDSEKITMRFYNFRVDELAGPIDGSMLNKIPECLIFAINHDGLVTNFTDSTLVQQGDILYIDASNAGLQKLTSLLNEPRREA